MSGGMILIIPIPKDVVGGIELRRGEGLEKALKEVSEVRVGCLRILRKDCNLLC
jgi:hypothetical protein